MIGPINFDDLPKVPIGDLDAGTWVMSWAWEDGPGMTTGAHRDDNAGDWSTGSCHQVFVIDETGDGNWCDWSDLVVVVAGRGMARRLI